MTRVQCRTCPWKKGADVGKIPNYREELHRALTCTIAEPGSLAGVGAPLNLMACHYSGRPGGQYPCVGWLHHQLGPGNNLPLRVRALSDRTLTDYRVEGPQRESFEETLPSGNGPTK